MCRVRATALKTDVEKAVPGARPRHKAELTSSLRVTILNKSWLVVPAGASLTLDETQSSEQLNFDISCDFLRFSAVVQLLRGMRPRGLSEKETEEVLKLLNKLGILVWIQEEQFRDLVMLNPRGLAVAMGKLMTTCFGVENFEHRDLGGRAEIQVIKEFENDVRKTAASDLRRFRTTGIARQNFINRIWAKDANAFTSETDSNMTQHDST